MTSPTGLGQPSVPLTSLGTDLVSGPSSVLDPAAQVAAIPGPAPTVDAVTGGDWARWGGLGAVSVASAYLGPKVATRVSPDLERRIRTQYNNVDRLRNYPKTRDAFSAARRARPSTTNTLRNATAGARSVISKTGGTLVNKAAARVPAGRTVVSLGRGVAAAGARLTPRVAGLAVRLGLRLALFAIPGPGWVVGAAVLIGTFLIDDSARRFVNNMVGRLFGVNNSPALDAPPEPPRTFFLPLTGDGGRDSVIDVKDREMVDLNNAAFGFDPDKVWHPTAPAIETTPTFESSIRAFEDLTGRVFEQREALESTFRKFRGEQVVDTAATALKPTVESLEAFSTTVLPGVVELVAAHAVQTNNLYLQLRDANNAARQEIANSGAGLLPWTSSVNADKMGQLADAYTTYAVEQDERNATIAKLFEAWTPPPALQGRPNPGGTGTGNGGQDQVKPDPYRPGPALPQSPLVPGLPDPGPGTGGGEKDGLSKEGILEELRRIGAESSPGQEHTPVDPFGSGMQNPFGSGMQNPFGSGMQNPFGAGMQSPLGGTGVAPGLNAQGAQPVNAGGKPDPAKLESKLRELLKDQGARDTVADKRPKDEKKDEKKAAVTEEAPSEESPADDGAGAGPVGSEHSAPDTEPESPAATVAHALGTEPPAPEPDPAMSRTAEVNGRIIEFEDSKSARMAEIMQPKDGTSPPTVQEAAAQAGFIVPPAGEPIGESVPPSDLRPGDLIMGDNNRNGLYLGDGQVLTGGEVRPVSDVANFTGDGHGVFRLEEAPDTTPTDATTTTEKEPPAQDADESHSTAVEFVPEDEQVEVPPEATATAVDDTTTTNEAPAAPPPPDAMPLPRSSTPPSDTADSAPAAPAVPVGD